jgi:hypothetical protein
MAHRVQEATAAALAYGLPLALQGSPLVPSVVSFHTANANVLVGQAALHVSDVYVEVLASCGNSKLGGGAGVDAAVTRVLLQSKRANTTKRR